MTDMTVANTILEHLGGKRFIAMTGAKNLTGDSDSLSFSLPSRFAKDGINRVVIRLERDLYTVETWKVPRRPSLKTLMDGSRPLPRPVLVGREDGYYADSLREVFTRMTGLETSLGSLTPVRPLGLKR